MALAANLIIFGSEGKPLKGSLPIFDLESSELSGCEIYEFFHRVYNIQKDYYYYLFYGTDTVRKHEPLCITKPIDRLSIHLRNVFVKGEFIPKIEIRWYEYNEKSRREVEYFRITLEHVRINSIKIILPNCKDIAKERYNHLETISFCYQKITWLYKKGYILYTDIWKGGFFSEEEEEDFNEKEDLADSKEGIVLEEPLKIKFTSGVFIEPEGGFQFGKKATVKFTYESNRKPTYQENKVYAKLYAVYNGKTEDMHIINEGRLVNENSWSTEFTLKKPTGYDENPASVEYYVVIENEYASGKYRSESVIIGSGKITLQKMEWKTSEVGRNEKVLLFAEFSDCKENEKAIIEILEYDHNGEHDLIKKIESNVKEGKVEIEWEFVYEEDTDDILTEEEAKKIGGKYRYPEYFFTIEIAGKKWGEKQESGLLKFKDWIEIKLEDENGNILPNEPFEIYLPDGSKYSGKLDDKGIAKVESVPPGPVEVVFPNYPEVKIKE